MTSRPRSRSTTNPSSTSASSRGVSTPAAARRAAPAIRASRIVVRAIPASAGGTLLQPPSLFVILGRVGELTEFPEQDLVGVVHERFEAVVLAPPLAVVVGADLLRAVA